MRSITTAATKDSHLITVLSVTTFRETFAKHNTETNMDAYIAESMTETVLQQELADKNNTFFLFWDGNVPAGYAKMRRGAAPATLSAASAIELERIYILEQHKGNGAGSILLQYCIDYATAGQYSDMWLGVWEHNTAAISFYRRMGFTQFGSHVFRLGTDEQTDLLFHRKLHYR